MYLSGLIVTICKSCPINIPGVVIILGMMIERKEERDEKSLKKGRKKREGKRKR